MEIDILVLEDNQERMKYFRRAFPGLVWSETAADCITNLTQAEAIGELWLDHDLGQENYVNSNRPDCGMEVVRFLEQNELQLKINKIFVHSHNTYAAQQMTLALQKADYNAVLYPFRNLLEELKK